MSTKTTLEIPQVHKVETVKEDLGMWGEYYGISITFSNGRVFTQRIEEHQYDHFHRQATADTGVIEHT